jgi:competence protein ComK
MTVNQKNLIEEYEINPFTMIILPEEYGSRTYSRVIELEEEYLSPFRPIDIIKKSCKYFGSSYEGRKEGTTQLTGITHKVPIIIDPISSIYFMPTSSPSNPDCIWVAQEHVLFHKKADSYSTQVIFRNNKSIILPVSHHSFENQLLRTSLLRTKFMQRMKDTERKALYLLHGHPNGYAHASMVSENYKNR